MKECSATIVITTKNRKHDLSVALDSCVMQKTPVEVIVIDDGSSDGTSEMVKSNFPHARLFSFTESEGYISRRNYGALLASNEIIFSIDDDAAFSSPNVVERTLEAFTDPRIAAIAIPFINVNQSNQAFQVAPDSQETWISNEYIGTAHAIRKDIFRQMGGYCEAFIHQGEEGDLCIRLLDHGYFIRLGIGDPIHHFESPNRNGVRMNFYGQRNLILFTWRNVPFPSILAHLPITIINGLKWGFLSRSLIPRIKGTISGLIAILMGQCIRSPVKISTYRMYRKLKKRGPATIHDIVIQLSRSKE